MTCLRLFGKGFKKLTCQDKYQTESYCCHCNAETQNFETIVIGQHEMPLGITSMQRYTQASWFRAPVAELVDARDSKSRFFGSARSIRAGGTSISNPVINTRLLPSAMIH